MPVLAAVRNEVSALVERAVAKEVASRPAEASPQTSSPPAPARTAPPPVVVTDQMVAQIASKLRVLAREERFRAGRLR